MTHHSRAALDFLLDAVGLALLALVAVLLLGGALSDLPRPLVAGVLFGGGFGLMQMLGRHDEPGTAPH